MKIRSLFPKDWSKDAPMKYEPENIFASMQNEMNRMFEEFSRAFSDFSPVVPKRWEGTSFGAAVPRVDAIETGDAFEISAELPGMTEKDIEVSLSGNLLTLKGEKKAEKETKGKDYYRMERSYGSFHRSIPIPAEFVPEKVEASFKNGVLTVTLPKTEKAREEVKKIPIKAA